jgi:YggT family protein
MLEFIGFISQLIRLFEIILFASIVMQLLLQFNVIPYSNPMVRTIYQGLYAVTEPVLAPIRRRLPRTQGLDFSPLVLIIILMFIQAVVLPVVARNVA